MSEVGKKLPYHNKKNMAKATLIKDDNKVVVESGSQEAQNYFSQGYQLMGSPAINPSIKTNTPTNSAGELVNPTPQDVASFNNQFTTTTAPQGSVAIDGAKFNTKETQQANFTNIQPIGNTLYGIPKAPVVPNIIPQTDLNNALSSETSAQTSATAQGFVGFNEQQVADLNKANLRVTQGTATETDLKNLEYAKSKGWQPAETKEETLKPASATVIGEPNPMKSTTDQIFEKMWNMGALRQQAKAEAMKDQNLMAKGEAIATAETFLNKLRTELENKEIFDIKEQDVIRAKPILTSQIQGQLNELSRDQKLDAMILQNNYNNALVELQIAEGNYDRAREIVKETADDVYEASMLQIEALQFRNQIENIEADRLRENLEYERSLSLEGYTHIKSPEQLKGLTESEIFRDPVSGKIYMKPEPTISRIMEVNGRQVGLDDKGNVIRDFGAVSSGSSGGGGGSTPTVIPGVDTSNMTKEEIKALEAKIKEFNNDINKELDTLARGGDWGASWNFIKNRYPMMTNQEVDDALNAWHYNPGSQSNQIIQTPSIANEKETPKTPKTPTITATPGSIDWNNAGKLWEESKKYLGIK
jgi:hypothetical protein